MFATSKDILNISLAGGFILLVIFLSVMLIYLILILRDVNKITNHTRDTAKKMNEFIVHPLKIMYKFGEKLEPLFDIIESKLRKKAEEFKKKKKK